MESSWHDDTGRVDTPKELAEIRHGLCAVLLGYLARLLTVCVGDANQSGVVQERDLLCVELAKVASPNDRHVERRVHRIALSVKWTFPAARPKRLEVGAWRDL